MVNDFDLEDWQAIYDERAGIVEYDGKYPRKHAEAMARKEIMERRGSIAGLMLTTPAAATNRRIK